MTGWEYETIENPVRPVWLVIQHLEKAGWELVASGNGRLIFRRPKQQLVAGNPAPVEYLA